MNLTKSWRAEIKDKWGIETIENYMPEDVLWSTRCSKTKSGRKFGIPREFYVSPTNLLFYDWAERANVPYGILSDKYGIHFYDEELEFYDIHPSSLTDDAKKKLGSIIQAKAVGRGFGEIVFWNSSPIMSRPYFEMLFHSNLIIYYMTKLPDLSIKMGKLF